MASSEPQLLTPGLSAHPGRKRKSGSPQHATRVRSGVYLMAAAAFDQVYAPEARALISSRVRTSPFVITPEDYRASCEVWPEVEIIFSGWGHGSHG